MLLRMYNATYMRWHHMSSFSITFIDQLSPSLLPIFSASPQGRDFIPLVLVCESSVWDCDGPCSSHISMFLVFYFGFSLQIGDGPRVCYGGTEQWDEGKWSVECGHALLAERLREHSSELLSVGCTWEAAGEATIWDACIPHQTSSTLYFWSSLLSV